MGRRNALQELMDSGMSRKKASKLAPTLQKKYDEEDKSISTKKKPCPKHTIKVREMDITEPRNTYGKEDEDEEED